MPRLARTVVVGWAHHITQRGNNRQDVFLVDDDRRVYLEVLREQAAQSTVSANAEQSKRTRRVFGDPT